MENIILSPSKYIQGINALANVAKYAKKDAFVIADSFIMEMTKRTVEESFNKENLKVTFELFNGECSKLEINRLKEILNEKKSQIVIGIGGGKTLDSAKALAHYTNLPVLIAPTIASSDAPCTALSVFYTELGVFDEYLFLPSNPDVVLMDTAIIAKAPTRLLTSGMGDALATYFEARSCESSNSLNLAGGINTKAAMALAKLCYNTLLSDGKKAILAAEKGVCTKAVENIIEANTYLSGIGAESGGLAAAHSIHNGLTILEECHHFYHGEKVAFGTLVQLFLENAPLEEVDEVLLFCKDVNLPTSLKDLGIIKIDYDRLLDVAKLACAPGETIYNMPFEVTPEKVLAAILAADNYGSC